MNLRRWATDAKKLKAEAKRQSELLMELCRSTYKNNGNLAIQCWMVENGVFTEPWATLTVNLNEKLNPNCAYVDTNNCSSELVNAILENGFATETYRLGFSGYCVYPEFEFTSEFLQSVVA